MSRTGWVATTNAHPQTSDPQAALDANAASRFSSHQPQSAGLFYQVNLGSKQTFDELGMAVPSSPTDYATAFQVQVSNDGTNWATVANCLGTGTPEVVSFAPQNAQYVKVMLTGAAKYWWSIDELNLYTNGANNIGASCTATLSGSALGRDGWSVSTNAHPGTSNPRDAIDGNFSSRFSSGEPQSAGLFYQLNMGSKQSFDQLVMQVPNSATDYARGYEVQVSNDGANWTTVASCVGSGTPEVVSFPTQSAQYVQVVLTGSAKYWWSIDEINLYTKALPPPTPAPVLTTTQLLATPNPVTLGAMATYTAKVVAPGNVTPNTIGGTVEFIKNGGAIPGCNAVPVVNGQASCTFKFSHSGYRTVIAVYSGSKGLKASSAATTNELVQSATSLSLSASLSPARIGEPVNYTARIIPGPATGGTVSFLNEGTVAPGCDAVPVVSGKATCAITFYSTGAHTVKALYSGTTGFLQSFTLANELVNVPPTGYWLVTRSGGVLSAGAAPAFGGISTSATTGPAAGIASTPSGKGYWVVTSRGAITAFGNAKSYGDLPSQGINASDIVAIAPTRDGHGYWLVGKDGGMFTFGDARFHGSVPGIGKHISDIVGMVASSSGAGYLVVGADGGVFTFGSAHFYGSIPGLGKHVTDIRAILPSSTAHGYVLVGADGGAFVFGSGVKFMGSLPGEGVHVNDIVGIALTPDNSGYFMASSNGAVFGFGSAKSASAPSGLQLPVVAIAGT